MAAMPATARLTMSIPFVLVDGRPVTPLTIWFTAFPTCVTASTIGVTAPVGADGGV
jgi:hypothetical protein